jgi:hypothetical protein
MQIKLIYSSTTNYFHCDSEESKNILLSTNKGYGLSIKKALAFRNPLFLSVDTIKIETSICDSLNKLCSSLKNKGIKIIYANGNGNGHW